MIEKIQIVFLTSSYLYTHVASVVDIILPAVKDIFLYV